jgi:hypothetical protein
VATLAGGDPAHASELYAQSQAIAREHGDRWWLGIVLTAAVIPALLLEDLAQARAHAAESLRARRDLRDKHGNASTVEFLGLVAAAADYRRPARLLAAADRHWRTVGGTPFVLGQMRSLRDEYQRRTRQALGDAAFDTELRRGSELTLDEATAYALGGDDATPKQHPAAATPTHD